MYVKVWMDESRLQAVIVSMVMIFLWSSIMDDLTAHLLVPGAGDEVATLVPTTGNPQLKSKGSPSRRNSSQEQLTLRSFLSFCAA